MKSIFQKHFCLCMPVTGMVLVKRFNNLLWGYLVLSKRPTLEIMSPVCSGPWGRSCRGCPSGFLWPDIQGNSPLTIGLSTQPLKSQWPPKAWFFFILPYIKIRFNSRLEGTQQLNVTSDSALDVMYIKKKVLGQFAELHCMGSKVFKWE